MGALQAMRLEDRETFLLVELEVVDRRQCLIVARWQPDDDWLECECLPEEGVRVDGKLTTSFGVPLELGDNVRVEYGSQFATIRYQGCDGDVPYLDLVTSTQANVRRVSGGGYLAETGRLAFVCP